MAGSGGRARERPATRPRYLRRPRDGVCDSALAAALFAALLDFELDSVFAAADAAFEPV